jgi:hypothetical protein
MLIRAPTCQESVIAGFWCRGRFAMVASPLDTEVIYGGAAYSCRSR